jgi:hypothetical protein
VVRGFALFVVDLAVFKTADFGGFLRFAGRPLV